MQRHALALVMGLGLGGLLVACGSGEDESQLPQSKVVGTECAGGEIQMGDRKPVAFGEKQQAVGQQVEYTLTVGPLERQELAQDLSIDRQTAAVARIRLKVSGRSDRAGFVSISSEQIALVDPTGQSCGGSVGPKPGEPSFTLNTKGKEQFAFWGIPTDANLDDYRVVLLDEDKATPLAVWRAA